MSTTKTTKKGGALMNDVKNIVVPFGLILAEKGLRQLSKDDKKSKKEALKSEIKDGQKAAVGGKKAAKKPVKKDTKKKGGSPVQSLHNEFSKLSNEIDNFLAKHG